MKRLLVLAAAVAAGLLAKRAWQATHLPLAVARGDRFLGDEVDDDRAPVVLAEGDDAVLGTLLRFDEHVVALADATLNRPMSEALELFASLLRDEHRLHQDHTRALVDKLGLELAQDATAADMEAEQFATRARLAREDDDDFEAAWLEVVIDDHERMLDGIDRAIEEPASDDERVLEHLRLSRAHLEHHVAEARMLV